MKRFNLKVLLVLALGHLTVDIYQGALPAILPFLKSKLALSYTTAGLLLMISNLAASVVQPLFGYYSDKKTLPLLLPLGLFCAGMGFSFLCFPGEYLFLLFLVMLSGLGVAAYHPEGYKTASFFTGEKSATGMSIFSVGGNIGFSLGPMIALLIIGHLGFSWLPLIIIPSLACILVLFFYRESITFPAVEKATGTGTAASTAAPAYPSLFLVIAIVIMRTWTQLGLVSYIPFYYIDYLKGDPLFAGKLVFTYLICGAVGTLIGAPIADRWGYAFFLRLSMFLSAVILPLIFIPYVQQSLFLFIVLGLQGAVMISSFGVTVVMSHKLLPQRLGVASGLMVGFAIGTGGIGVTLLGVVADHYGVPFAMKTIMVLPFIGFLLSLFLGYKERAKL